MPFCVYNLQADQSKVRHAQTQAQAQQPCQPRGRAAESMSAAAAGMVSPSKSLCCFLTHTAIARQALCMHGLLQAKSLASLWLCAHHVHTTTADRC